MGVIRNILKDLLNGVDSHIASKVENKMMKITQDKCKEYEYRLPDAMKRLDVCDNGEKGQNLLLEFVANELATFDATTQPMIDTTESAEKRRILEKKQCMLAEGIISKIEMVYEEYVSEQIMNVLGEDDKFTLLITRIRRLEMWNIRETYGYHDLLRSVLCGSISMDEVQNKDDIVDKFRSEIIKEIVVDMSLYRTFKQGLLQDKQLKKFVDRRCWLDS